MSLIKDKSDKSLSHTGVLETDVLNFTYLPAYAQFLLDKKLEELTQALLTISREIEVPLLRFFENLPEEELIKLSIQGTQDFLNYFATNQVSEFIELSLKRWIENQLPLIQHDEIVARDISTVNFARRKALRQFLPEYTSDFSLYAEILTEIDLFILTVEDRSYKTLFNLKQQHINEHLYFIDKINNTLPGVIYIYDLPEQKEIYSTNSIQDIPGYDSRKIADIDGSMFTSQLHPDDIEKRLEYLQSFSNARDGEIRSIEYRIKHKNGRFRWIRAYETLFKRTSEGTPWQIIGLSLDVHHEKESAQKLQLRELQLNEAYKIAGLGSFEWDLQGGESYLSDQMMKIFDLNEKLDFLSFLKFVHPADQIKLTESINEAITGAGRYECEYRYQKAEEKVIWSCGVVTFRNGMPDKMRGTVMDVTERNLMLQKLEETIELHKQAQALTHIGNWTWDIPHNKIEWSDEMYRIYGLEPQSEEIHFERFVGLVHPDDRERRIDEIQRALSTGIADDYILRIVWDDGTLRILQGKGEVILDEFGKPVKLAGTCQDVTEQFNVNREIERKNIELQRRNEELTAFNYIASHDLQEPLRKIKLFSNHIYEKDSEALPPVAKEFLPRIISAAEQMQKLFNDLLAFSRATLSHHIFEKTNLNAVLEEVKTSLKDSIEEKQVRILSASLPELNVIQYQFRQLLENIIVNAIKYSKADITTEIAIEAQIVDGKAHLKDGATAGQKYHKLSVSDNGIGFDQQYAEKIFELFQRLHNKNEYSGTGIGLAICKKIIQNHQGFITAAGEPGKGATFHIFIPVG